MGDGCTRRALLSGLGAGAFLGTTAGCVSLSSSTNYQFSTVPAADSVEELADGYLWEDYASKNSQYDIGYSDEYKHSVIEDLIDEGAVETTEWQLSDEYDFGTTMRSYPNFLADDGSYYRVREVGQREVTETRWVFYIESTDSNPPSSADVVTEPPDSLSSTDAQMVQKVVRARERYLGESAEFGDGEITSPHRVFHDDLDPERSSLVPSPPFDYVQIEEYYYEASTDQFPVEQTVYEYSLETVGSSREVFESYVANQIVDARFDSSSTSDAVDEILRTVTDPATGRLYQEAHPPSDGLQEIMDRLGVTDHMPEELPEDDRVEFDRTVFAYDGTLFHGQFDWEPR